MKKYEYMRNDDINEKYNNYGIKGFTAFLNKLGAEGWEIMPEPRPNSYGAYFARREIDEPASQH